jgi:molecular chaperone GrpE
MSKQKPQPHDDRPGQDTARAGKREDPMTSFDPKREANADPASGTTAAPHPAPRAPQGNGSERTTQTSGQETPPPQPATDAAPGTADAAADVPDESPPPKDDMAARLEAATEDAAAHYDRFLRLQAEFDNYKRRIQKEHTDSLRYALTPLVRDVATVLDNLERALAHARKEPGEPSGALLEGIEMVARQMRETLERFGVTRIEAVGKPFDPALHEALTVVERNDVPENQVLEELQAGYLLHERVVRPARVSVSKRGNEETQAHPPAGG